MNSHKHVTSHKQTTEGNDYTTGYTYSLSGQLLEQTYPSGRVVKNTYDAADGSSSQVQSKRSSETYRNFANGFITNAAGAVTAMRLGNGKWENTVFNSRMQPTQIGLGNGVNSQDMLKLQYEYGATASANNGNVTKQTITVPGVANPFIQTYAYDELNRLTNAEEIKNSVQQWEQTFSYDRFGNRNFNEAETTTLPKNCGSAPNLTVCAADKKIVNPSINTANNRLSTSDNYAFDSVGNTTGDAEGRTFVYDAENKQVSVSDTNGTIGEYFYDGDGRRIKKYVPSTGEETIFVYDAGSKLIGEYSTVVQTGSNAKTVYTTNDRLGSPRINTDATGQVISRHDYHPFGEEVSRSEYGSDTIRKQFTGYERDSETELDFAQARYFASGHGRFSSPDDFLNDTSIHEPQSWNLYVYVRNNPLNFVDPTGKEIWVLFEEEEEYEEDGEKKKRMVTRYAQYRDGKLWSDFSNGVEYAGDNNHARKIQSDLNDIVAKGGAGEIKRLAEDTLFHGVGHRDFGNREIRGETDPNDGGKAIWDRGDTKSGSMTYYDTQTAESDSKGITAASLARELLGPATDFANANYTDYDPHRYRIYSDVQGTHYQRSEVWRMQIDDRVRRDFGLPSREFFGGQRIPKGSIVCEWSIRNGRTSCN